LLYLYFSFIELESSGWRKELRLNFLHKSRTRTESFSLNIADNRWHRIAVSVSNGANHVKLLLDCEIVYERRLTAPLFHSLTTIVPSASVAAVGGGDVNLWLGQRNSKQGYFKVSVVIIVDCVSFTLFSGLRRDSITGHILV